MSLIKCAKCGELFSDSYRSCPFCAEDEEYYKWDGKKKKHRSAGEGKKHGLLIPLLILVLVLLAAGTAWYFFGDEIKGFLTHEDTKPPVEEVTPGPDDGQDVQPTVVLVMDKTLRLAPNESKALTISGGTSYEWISSDPTVATVNSSGTVTAISEGTTIITATDTSGANAVCSVTVTEESGAETSTKTDVDTGGTTGGTTKPVKPTSNSTPGTTTTPKVDLSKVKFTVPAYAVTLQPTADGSYDVSIWKSRGENSFQVAVEGTSAKASWTSANSNVATVDADGTFHAVSYGETTVTAKLGDASVSFLVRIQ